MNKNEIIPHLFRSEYSKLVSVLSKIFGLENVDLAEDIVSDTFLLAIETWPYKGVPENPTAWLYKVAKNKTVNFLQRNRTFIEKVRHNIKKNPIDDKLDIDFSVENIQDNKLQLLFTICQPILSPKAQIILALRLICGFGLDEIADAFLTNKSTIHKILQRAKIKLRSKNVEIEFPPDSKLNSRLEAVLRTIYLLFSEGYYSESRNTIVRKDLCLEAIHLNYLLLDTPITNTHDSNALLSLMCFHASRIEARQTKNGEIILYEEQNRKLWNSELIEKGFYYLQQASKWEKLSKYYIEASIAYWHTVDNENPIKWESILKLYETLLVIDYSPVADLNRIFALSKAKDNLTALKELEKLNLKNNHFYFVLLSDLYKKKDVIKSLNFLEKAKVLSKNETENQLISKRIEMLKK